MSFFKNYINWINERAEIKDVKEGVDSIFEENPELESIGTESQYSDYLDSIFPDSKVKDIIYHGSNNPNIVIFKESPGAFGTGIYFQTQYGKYHTSSFGKNVYSVIINTKKPYEFYKDFKGQDGTLTDEFIKMRSEHEKTNTLHDLSDDFNNEIRKSGYDSKVIQLTDKTSFAKKDTFWYLVFEPEQIHILGSKEDIEGFKEYMNK